MSYTPVPAKFDAIQWTGDNLDAVQSFFSGIDRFEDSNPMITVNDDGSLYCFDELYQVSATVPPQGWLIAGPYVGDVNNAVNSLGGMPNDLFTISFTQI